MRFHPASRRSGRCRRGALAPALLGLAVLAACPGKSNLVGQCQRDEDCGNPLDYRCELETGECRCRSNVPCKPGEFCNAQGYCQASVGCYETRDCPAGFFCDVATNTCLQEGRCASDQHCPFGQICDRAAAVCRAGCRVDGDCTLGEVCLCAASGDAGSGEAPCPCAATSDAERAACAVGRCASGTCRDNAYCGNAEACRVPAGGGLARCESDHDPQLRPYCDNCVFGPGTDSCGTGPNFCLYSTYTQSNYCGVDCSRGQECAHGFDCRDVIVVWLRTQCRSEDECKLPGRRTTIRCLGDADCPNGGACDTSSGYCYGKCTFHEGAKMSFCSCVADEDCAQDSCDPVTFTCGISRQPCSVAAQDCRKIRCVDFGGQGGCLIGQNCKPLEGLTCSDVMP